SALLLWVAGPVAGLRAKAPGRSVSSESKSRQVPSSQYMYSRLCGTWNLRSDPRAMNLTRRRGERILPGHGGSDVDTTRDPTPACAFCDGSGLWPDVDGDAAPDPCPLCDGSGRAPAVAPATADAADGDPLLRLLGIL